MTETPDDPRSHVLRQKFSKLGLSGLSDAEVVELFLELVVPREESGRRAPEYVKRFTNLRGLLKASKEELQQAGLPCSVVLALRLLRELPSEILKEKLIEQPVYRSSREIFDYLHFSMRDLEKEVFKVIYLGSKGQILEVNDVGEGSHDSVYIRPREIVEKAVNHSTAGLIFVHNHPSGDPVPSASDSRLTRDLVFMGNILQIRVFDHIIIAGDGYFSFADAGLIQKFEDSFLNLRIRSVGAGNVARAHTFYCVS